MLHEAGFPAGHFDVVHANEVFEHVEDPVELVQQVLAVLRPGGVLVFRTPNHRSWTARSVRSAWREYGVFEKGHVGFFSPRSARRLLVAHGFSEVAVETRHFSLRDRWPVRTPGLAPLLRLGYRLIGQLARPFGRGERMTVYAQRAGG